MAKQSNVSWRQRTNLGRDQVRITTLDDPRMIKAFYCSMINSTSKMRVALGGIGPCPRGPYLESALVNLGMVVTFIYCMYVNTDGTRKNQFLTPCQMRLSALPFVP